MAVSAHFIPYDDFIDRLSGGGAAVVSAINFEDCCSTLCSDLLAAVNPGSDHGLTFYPFRLTSTRASPWSALELVKIHKQHELEKLAKAARVQFDVTLVEYPTGRDVVLSILERAKGGTESSPPLVVDLSSVPRELAVYLCDAILGLNAHGWHMPFKHVYLAHTPPQSLTNRSGLGPSSVGSASAMYFPTIIRQVPQSMTVNLVVFPGDEGFEAKAAIDELIGYHTRVTVAINCFDPSLAGAVDRLVANQALLADAVTGKVELKFFFSPEDALRVAAETVDSAVRLCSEAPTLRHMYLAAPFGPKLSLSVACVARRMFVEACATTVPETDVLTDVMYLPTSQYVSLYSRGATTPQILEVQL